MSDVKRYCMGAFVNSSYSSQQVVLADDYDSLAQRCRELEEQRNESIADGSAVLMDLDAAEAERDTLRAEVERLRVLLKQAAAMIPRDYQDEESLARQIDKEIAAWNAPTTGATPEA